MIGFVNHPTAERPGFCQKCYCERCSQGFYDKAKDAMKFSDGRIKCAERGCDGDVKPSPTLSWRRLKPCRECKRTAAAA